MFLVVAPLGPLAGVAVAFAGGLDPNSGDRAGRAVLGVAVAAHPYDRGSWRSPCRSWPPPGFALPGSQWLAAAWLLPTAGLTCAALALTGRMPPVVAVASWPRPGCWCRPDRRRRSPRPRLRHRAQVFWLALAIGGGTWLRVTRNTVAIKLGRSA